MIYLDNSATGGFKPKSVIDACQKVLEHPANPGRSGHSLSLSYGSLVFSTRRLLRKHFNCESEERVIFTRSCSESLNLAIFGLCKKGWEVITTVYEHNSVLRPLHHLAKLGVISLKIASPDENGVITASCIEKLITRKTKMVVVNHISNVSGAVADIYGIGAVSKRHRLIFLVDAAQSGGYVKIDMESCNINLLALAPHKGLHSPMGVGVLLISALKERLSPINYGGTGLNSESLEQGYSYPESYETGTLPLVAIAGLNAGIIYTFNNFDKNALQLNSLKCQVEKMRSIKGLTAVSHIDSVGIFTFNLKGYSCGEVSDILNTKYNICVRSGLTCAPLAHKYLGTNYGAVRVSYSSFNTVDEIFTLTNGIKEIVET